MINTSLCYIYRGDEMLLLHRTKKKNDLNHDKWIGIGGKFEEGESPEECALREVRGQVVKASIVLTKGTEPTDELKKEIQQYVKVHTAPYKYPRIVVFCDSLPKTVNGKIVRSQL